MEHLTIAQRNAHNAKLASYARRPLAFLFRYIQRHPLAHAIVLCSVFAAVGCALASQYAIKHLIDVLGAGRHHPGPLWSAFAILVGLIAADNLLWRVGGWVAAHTFVTVTGDLVGGLLGDVPAERVSTALVGADLPLLGLDVRRPSLEQVFVELTGEGFDVAR